MEPSTSGGKRGKRGRRDDDARNAVEVVVEKLPARTLVYAVLPKTPPQPAEAASPQPASPTPAEDAEPTLPSLEVPEGCELLLAPPPRGAPRVVSLDRDVLTDGDAPLAPGSSVELCAGGAARDVDASNRHDFVRAMRDWRLRKSLRLPLEAMARGLRKAVPRDVLVDARKMLSADDFGRLLSGLRDVDVRFPASCVRREDFARSAAVFFRTAASSSRDINPGESESHPRVPLTRAALVP